MSDPKSDAKDAKKAAKSQAKIEKKQAKSGNAVPAAEEGPTPAEADIRMEPSTTVSLEGKEAETMLDVADALEDLDDVQNVYANFDITEEEMARIAG